MHIRLNRVVCVGTALWAFASLSFAQESVGRVAPLPQSTPSSAHSSTGKVSASAEKPTGKRRLLDLNNATRDELKSLPGANEALADKIIAGRPYGSKADLVSHGILLAGPYQSIRKHVFVGPVKKSAVGVPKK